MKIYNGLEVREGCLLCFPQEKKYRRVDFVGKEGDSCICASYENNKINALNCAQNGLMWARQELMARGAVVCTYKPLGMYDRTGKEIHDQDEVEYHDEKYKVFGGIKARGNSKDDFVLFEDKRHPGEWNMAATQGVKVCSRPTETINPKNPVKIEKRKEIAGIYKSVHTGAIVVVSIDEGGWVVVDCAIPVIPVYTRRVTVATWEQMVRNDRMVKLT